MQKWDGDPREILLLPPERAPPAVDDGAASGATASKPPLSGARRSNINSPCICSILSEAAAPAKLRQRLVHAVKLRPIDITTRFQNGSAAWDARGGIGL